MKLRARLTALLLALMVPAALCLLCLTDGPQAASQTLSAQAGPPQVCFYPDKMKGGPTGLFDGLISYRWPPLVGEVHPILYGSDGNGGVMARLDMRAGLYQKCEPAKGLPAYYRYAAGAGDIITNPLDGSWLAVAHLERAAPKSPQFFWGSLAFLRSTDYGQSWSYLGIIIEPAVPYTDPLSAVCEIGGGSTCLVNGEYYYCYFRETGYDGKGRAGLAYCRAVDVWRYALRGEIAPWRKWSGGDIPNSADPLAVGGGQSESLPGMPLEADWWSVKYRADRQRYVAVVCPFAEQELSLYDSPDAVHWTGAAGGAFTNGEPGAKFYPSLVGLNPDERFITGDPWVYYLVTPNKVTATSPFQWKGSEVRRRMLNSN